MKYKEATSHAFAIQHMEVHQYNAAPWEQARH